MRMNNTMVDVNSKLENFQNLKSKRKRPPGMNTSRSKVSVSNARLNMKKFKPQDEVIIPRLTMADEVFA